MIEDPLLKPTVLQHAPSSLLIVEDAPAHLRLLKRALRLAFPACHVQEAASLDEAESLLAEHIPDLILCDMRLPGGSGLYLLRSGRGPNLPIICLTSLHNDEQAIEAMRLGALDFIVKSADAFTNIGPVILRAHRQWQLRQSNQQMQTALAQSEARYRHLFDNAPIMYVITEETESGPIITECNTLFLETLGYTRDEVLLQPLQSFYDTSSQKNLLEGGGYARALIGALDPTSRTLVTRNGRLIETEMRTQPDIGNDGRVIGTRAIYVNLTPQKQTAQQLLFLEAAASSSSEGITIVDARQPDIPFVYVNEGFEKLTGYTAAETIGRGCAFLQNGDTDQPDLRTLYRAFQEGTNCHVVLRNYRKDGSLFMNDLHLSPIRNEAGHVTHFVGLQRDVTEEYNATKEIEYLRNFYERILDNAPAQIAVFDDQGRYTYINPASITSPELRRWLLGKTAADYAQYRNLDPAAFEERTRWLKDVIRSGEPSEHEEVIPTRHGRAHSVLRMAVPLKDERGKVTSVVGYGMDLTKIRQAELALRESQTFIKGMAQAMPQILYVCEPHNSKTVYLNRSFRPLLGYGPSADPEKELVFLRTLVHPDDATTFTAFTEKTFTLADGEMCGVEYRVCHANGTLLWFAMRTSILKRTSDGAVHQLVGIIDDITSRKQAEARIQSQAALLNKAPDAILTYDLSGTVTYINQSACSLFNWDKDTVLGTPVTRWFDDTAHIPFLDAQRRSTSPWLGEYSFARDEHGLRTLALRLSLIHDDAGQPSVMLLTGTDITARKRYEERLLRTQRLESLGTLAGGIAHDLNNILNPILMGTGILKRQIQDASAQATLNIIESSTERGAALVKQVLTFARGIEGEKAPIQPGLILKEVLRLIRETFPRTLTIQSQIASALPLVLADSTQLQQVIMNLCVNARDAVDEDGTIQIKAGVVTLTSEDYETFPDLAPGPYVTISVRDNGAGIEESMQTNIFEPFFTTKPLQSGTGLGLSIVAGIIKNHEGSIHVESMPNEGSTFTVYLPALPAAQTPRPDCPALGSTPQPNATILLVEDEPSLRHIVQKALQQDGYTVLIASNGSQAINQFRQYDDTIDLVLTDITMPNGDGVTTIETLRALSRELNIIATSGLPLPEETIERLNIQAFLPKPYPVDTLKQTLHRVLSLASA